MKTASVRELRNEFRRLSKWINQGESIQIVKRGKPFARLIPERRQSLLLGALSGTGTVPKDLDEPVGVAWKAAE